MPRFILSFFTMMISGYCCNWFVSRVVPMKAPWKTAWIPTLVAMAIWTVNHYVLSSSLAVLDLLIHIAGCGLLLPFIPAGCRFWGCLSRIVLLLCQYIVEFILAVVALPLGAAFGISAAAMTAPDSYITVLMTLLCTGLSIPAMYLSTRLLKRLYRPVSFSPWLLLFAAIPISQVVLVDLCLRVAYPTGQYEGISGNLAVGILLSLAADIAVFVGIYKYRQAQLLKSHVQMAQAQLDAQAAHYRQLQQSILSVNQIRHDLSNQLQAAYHLLDKGEAEQVRQQLDVLQDSIRSRVGPSYCANLMADAVLAEKARLCKEKGIRLSVAVELPSQLPMENAHLCSVFSNLLDNSIQGVLESGAEDKHIDLRAVIKAGCLSIHCSNPAVKTKKKRSVDPLRTHGLGLEILEQLAKRYNGSMQSRFVDGVFETVLILCLSI